MHKKSIISPLLLASESVTRKKILKDAGFKFSCYSPCKSIEEKTKKKIKGLYTGKKTCLLLAESKALSIKNCSKYILSSDQLCIDSKGNWIEKPKSRKEAFSQLKNISGKKHTLYTSAVLYKSGKKIWETVERVDVSIRFLSEEKIEKYLKKISDKQLFSSGVYCIEKEGSEIIDNISGDYFSILGFPLKSFLQFTEKLSEK